MGRLLDEDMVINALQTTKFRNDLFVDRGYARAISIIKELPTIQPEEAQLSQEGTTFDLISRQAALEKVRAMQTYKLFMGDDMILVDKADVQTELMMLPTVQPEPAIPLSWIDKYTEWLHSFSNEFANLAAAHISVMVKKWRDEQNETD